MPLGVMGMGWQPRLQGSMGTVKGETNWSPGSLDGDTSEYDTFAIQFGGGARFWFTDKPEPGTDDHGDVWAHTE